MYNTMSKTVSRTIKDMRSTGIKRSLLGCQPCDEKWFPDFEENIVFVGEAVTKALHMNYISKLAQLLVEWAELRFPLL